MLSADALASVWQSRSTPPAAVALQESYWFGNLKLITVCVRSGPGGFVTRRLARRIIAHCIELAIAEEQMLHLLQIEGTRSAPADHQEWVPAPTPPPAAIYSRETASAGPRVRKTLINLG